MAAEPLLPVAALAGVRDRLDELTDDVLAAAQDAEPAYAEVLAGPDGLAIRLGTERALAEFVERLEDPDHEREEAMELWRRLGRAEFQAGRTLAAVQGAFRAGSRAAVRGATQLAAEMDLPATAVATLAEQIFIFIDELTSSVVEGYVRAQSDEAGERERHRRRLAALLVDDVAHDPETVSRAAGRARWPLPRTLAALAVATDAPGSVATRLGVDALVGTEAASVDGPVSWLLVPDPDGPGRSAALAAAVKGVPAAIGPAVPPAQAHLSLRLARLTIRLARAGALPAAPAPVRADAHLGLLALLQDEELARALAAARLGPLAVLPEADRARLTETLASWLAHQRHVPSIAGELHVHPQTVRYRLGQLRELLGPALEAPDGRFELELALRAERALDARSGGAAGP